MRILVVVLIAVLILCAVLSPFFPNSSAKNENYEEHNLGEIRLALPLDWDGKPSGESKLPHVFEQFGRDARMYVVKLSNALSHAQAFGQLAEHLGGTVMSDSSWNEESDTPFLRTTPVAQRLLMVNDGEGNPWFPVFVSLYSGDTSLYAFALTSRTERMTQDQVLIFREASRYFEVRDE